MAYCKSVIDDLETRVYAETFNDPILGYRAVIDVENFAAWWLVQNICKNIDMNQYFYKVDKDTPLRLGPVWDAEWSFGIGDVPNQPAVVGAVIMPLYFNKLMTDPYFKTVTKQIWQANKVKIKEVVLARINFQYQNLMLSQEANFHRWNLLSDFVSIGNVALTTYSNEVQYIKDFFLKRCDWLDSYLAE